MGTISGGNITAAFDTKAACGALAAVGLATTVTGGKLTGDAAGSGYDAKTTRHQLPGKPQAGFGGGFPWHWYGDLPNANATDGELPAAVRLNMNISGLQRRNSGANGAGMAAVAHQQEMRPSKGTVKAVGGRQRCWRRGETRFSAATATVDVSCGRCPGAGSGTVKMQL